MLLKVFFSTVQLAFCCPLIYLFGSNFVALSVNASVESIEMVAVLSECSSQNTVADLYFQSPFGGAFLSLWRWF